MSTVGGNLAWAKHDRTDGSMLDPPNAAASPRNFGILTMQLRRERCYTGLKFVRGSGHRTELPCACDPLRPACSGGETGLKSQHGAYIYPEMIDAYTCIWTPEMHYTVRLKRGVEKRIWAKL